MKRAKPRTRKGIARAERLPHAPRSSLWSNPPLLSSERRSDFQALLDGFTSEIKPCGIIEEMYVNDVAWIVWEILRLRRCRTPILKAKYRTVLQELLTEFMTRPGDHAVFVRDEAEELAHQWFANEKGKEQVRRILGSFGLDESAIEAEVIRQGTRDLEGVDRLLMALEARRDKTLASIARHRFSFAKQLRETSGRLLEVQPGDAPRLGVES